MGIQRSSFYSWKKHLSDPSNRTRSFISNITLFREYHLLYPSHGYRWLNAKIRLDTGLVLSDPYAHKCCKTLGIKSASRHYRYKKPGDPYKAFPNLLMSEIRIDKPFQCIVSDMTAFYVKGIYYELTLYMDLWNNELVSHSLSAKRGDRMTYISGLTDLIELKNSIRNMKPSCIPIRDLFMPQRLLMIFCRCMESLIPCPGQEHRRTMQRWNPSMDGSNPSCLWIFMSQENGR